MGGIPVMRRSTISSCYDNSDNEFGGHKRGDLPVVILDSWEQLTKERLEAEWEKLAKFPDSHWDWRRLFIDQYFERIGCAFNQYGNIYNRF